ncbi:MAG TPA: Crp/Fnr family transcriptional regulator [Sphingomicrobium sp.]|nr:Crp/Fnr family transcriptional regulator [Sphingomicrobium sp.]
MTSKAHPLELFVADLMRHSKLGRDDQDALFSLPIQIRTLDAHSYLVREGVQPTRCSVLIDGYAFRQKVTGDGARQIMAVCITGDAVDLQNMFLDVADHAVQMLTRGTVADIQRSDLQNLILQRPAIGSAIIQVTLIEASILREWVVNIGRRDARERISHLLCEFAVRLEARGIRGGDGFELPMAQEQLADATGLTPVHVNRVLKQLEADGLISRKRRHIHFPDWRLLQEVGDFNRQYLHLPPYDVVAETRAFEQRSTA